MELRKLAETTTTITLGWDQVPNAEWFLFYAKNVRVSNAPAKDKNGVAKTSIKFNKGDEPYEVVAITRTGTGLYDTDVGVWNTAPPSSWTIAPPQGPLTEMNGGGTQSQAQFDYSVGPLTFEKKWIHDYTSYGYGMMKWPAQESPANVRSTIRDLRVERITRTPPRASDGTAEAGVWVGQTADVSRLDIASCAWMQIWTGARCYRSIFTDFVMRDTRLVGIYPEHNTWDTTFKRFKNEQAPGQLANTVNQEWWYSGEGSKNLTYDQFDLYVPANSWAFFIDAGNGGTKIAPSPGSRIWGPGNGIIFPNKIVPGLAANQAWLNNIDMSELSGTKLAYHDNAIGTFTQRMAAATRGLVGLAPKHHPATIRMPSGRNWPEG